MNADAILVVHTKIPPDREKEFNEWYDNECLPDVVRSFGAVRGIRYRSVASGEPTYLAIYEFESEEALEPAMLGPELDRLVREYEARWGEDSQRQRMAFVKLTEYPPKGTQA